MSTSSLAGPSRSRVNQSSILKRHSAFDDDEDEDEEEQQQQQRVKPQRNGSSIGRWKEEALSGYSTKDERIKKESRSAEKQLVIQKQADINWMEERKKRLGLEKYRKELGTLSGGFGGERRVKDGEKANTIRERVGDEEQKVGLEIRQRDEDDPMQIEEEEQVRGDIIVNSTDEDENARAALVSGKNRNDQQHENAIITPITEEEALLRDMDSRPDAPSLSDYSNMPVDDFGAALLRGMGWREGMGAGKQRQGPTSAPQVKKRAALLGLGAKEREKIEGLDDKKSGSMYRSPNKPERRYVPITRKEQYEKESERDSQLTRDRQRSSSPPSSRSDRYGKDKERSRRYDEPRKDRDRNEDRYSFDRNRNDKERERERRNDNSHRHSLHHRDRQRSER